MWSAPHQPFVLPVRIRSFEELYNGDVKLDPAIKPEKDLPAQKIQKAVSKRQDELAQKLKESLKASNVRFYDIPGVGVGIYKGQLYHLIRDIKAPNDYESENQLMEPLLSKILGQQAVKVTSHNNREYYYASKAEWDKALGLSIRITPVQN